ncbi:major histocompatibility complex class I-related gene protein-like [Ahaetulla prasina]|uniref:major histocompatibility complex class I-related gene protein-like n=1 Tax=Ahaetulla prasina TaxID=499056 RepID=UPI0026499D5D|nr:major histocompatibility complex class I-related gene protein-like [Ahaetulla prasina]
MTGPIRKAWHRATARLKADIFSAHEELLLGPSHVLPCSRNILWYSYLQVSKPNQGLPRFFSKAYLDDQPIARYDSHTRKVEPLVSWMEKVEKEDPNHGKEGNEMLLATGQVFQDELRSGPPLNILQAPRGYVLRETGLHTWQAILCCELREDESKGGVLHYGYDGMDFISFEKETLRWVTAQPQAQKVKEKWEEDPGWSRRNKIYLETCSKQLQSYLSYSKEALQRIEPPVGKVMHKTASDKVKVLICQAFGFYPKEIQAIWRRGEEECKYETLHRNVAPNLDGTYYVWLSIEIDPKERDLFSCHIKHDSLQEPLVLSWKEDPDEKLQNWGR